MTGPGNDIESGMWPGSTETMLRGMRAIDRTTELFIESVRHALPGARIQTQKSRLNSGRSNYVFIYRKALPPIKVRISDHPVGMRRALYGGESLFIHHLAKPASWAVWISEMRKHRWAS